MKFFFPDSHDLVDPSFNFLTESRDLTSSRQRSQFYAHEILRYPPYHGMLISRAAVEKLKTSVHYTFGQVQRLKRIGAKAFLRLDELPGGENIETMGDCGSFSFVQNHEPPFSIDSLVDFYTDCQFDYGISLDHVILGFRGREAKGETPKDWIRRYDLTISLAEQFHDRCTENNVAFVPIGAVQGWDTASYTKSFFALQKIGYKYIALGGLVPLHNQDVLSILEAIKQVRKPDTTIHLLGISRLDHLREFKDYGVVSFDSTSPLKKAFMDTKKNYYTRDRTYTAVRIPQVGENPALKKKILSGEVRQELARKLEKDCLQGIEQFDTGAITLSEIMERIQAYERLWHDSKSHSDYCRETLEDRPWLNCKCAICKEIGIQVVIFRGAERNRRRGFHNLHVLKSRLTEGQLL